ncbi:hypothetical protein V491_00195 [Pseudogymnoascus sp. VKM F-3775]|nr:hypothetical protein V491_00195 [Pseudogymnoascus sp. VKM F-3775]
MDTTADRMKLAQTLAHWVLPIPKVDTDRVLLHNTIYLAQEQRDGFISASNESARFMDAGKSSFESSSYDGLWYNTDMQDTTRLAEEEEKDPEGEFQYHISQEVFRGYKSSSCKLSGYND